MNSAKHRAPARPRVTGRLALTAAALALAVPATGILTAAPAAAANSDIVKASTSTRSADAQQLLALINAHRKAKGLAIWASLKIWGSFKILGSLVIWVSFEIGCSFETWVSFVILVSL